MKKIVKTTTALTLAATLAFPVPYSVLADGKKGNDDWKNVQRYDDDDHGGDGEHGKFGKHFDLNSLKDIQSSFWAKQNIELMYSLGLISGYPDGTFQPNKPVSNAEAVVMTINMLGLQDEAKKHDGDALTFKDANAIPQYAKGSVALAAEMGIISKTGVFQPNKGATRMDIVSMIVLALGDDADAGLEAMTDAKLQFTDVSQLTEQQRKMLAFAVVKQFVSGYDDKSFKPNKPVTRAEFATIIVGVLHKYFDFEDKVVFDYKVTGEVTGVNAAAKTVTVSHKNNTNQTVQTTFNVTDTARIYRDNKTAALADIEVTDKVELVIDQNSNVVYITAKSVKEEVKYLLGEITGISADRTLGIKIAGMLNVSLKVATDAVIQLDGKTVTFEQLDVNDKIQFSVNASGQISVLKATSAPVAAPSLPVELQSVRQFSLVADSADKDITVSFDASNAAVNSTVVIKTATTTTTLTGTEAQNYIKLWAAALNTQVIDAATANQTLLSSLGLTGTGVSVRGELKTTDRVLTFNFVKESDGDITSELTLNNSGAIVTSKNTIGVGSNVLELTLAAANLSVEASKKIENNTVSVQSKIVKDGTTEIFVGTEFSSKVTDYFKQYGLKVN